MKVTAISPDADDPRETAPPLSQLHPDMATELARFLALEAGLSLEDLEAFAGDPEFTAEVQAAMRALQTAGGAR